jgi:hypothetical protein
MPRAVPPVEIADYRNGLRIRRPDCKMNRGAVASPHDMRAQLVVQPVMRSLFEEKDIMVADKPWRVSHGRRGPAELASRSRFDYSRVHHCTSSK